MPENKNDLFKFIRLERNISYPFPAIVGIISIFIFLASYSILGIGRFTMNTYFSPGWNSTTVSGELGELVNNVSSRVITAPIYDCLYVVMLLAPLLIAFNLAQGYSNGQIRTLLSYPIKRRTVLLLKSGFVVLLMSISGTIGLFFSLLFFYPFSIELSSVLIMIVTFWISAFVITSTCTILAIVSRSAIITAFVGVGLWEIITPLVTQPFVHPVIWYLLFPFHIALSHVNPEQPPLWLKETSIIDVLIGSGSALLFGIVLLILSVYVFKRQEI